MDTELDELREWYTQHLVVRLDALLAAKEAFLAGNVTAADSIRRIAHTVKGSGSTYGFPEVTAAAAMVDHAPDDILLEKTEHLVEVLRSISKTQRKAEPPTILIVDDDESITKLFSSALSSEGYRILIATTGTEADQFLEIESISLVLLDLFLPDVDGRNVLVKIRKHARTSRVPILIITGHNSLATQKECLTLGADDLIEKPLEISKVVTLIQRRLSSAREADREARRDLLTGLPNRAALHEAFQPMAAQTHRLNLPLSIAILDLDLFKSINDTFGHPAGDLVLQSFARIERESLRASDVFGRWGGEEFVVLMPETDLTGAQTALEKSLAAFRAQTIDFQGSSLPSMSFSGGVVIAAPHDSLDSAVAAADRLLYRAKQTGRARICTTFDGETSETRSIMLIEHDPLIISSLTELLAKEGLRVVTASNADEARTGLANESFAAALIEIELPGGGGLATLKHLRSDDRGRATPVLMIASPGNEKDVYRALEAGANDYVIKPFSASELLTRLRRLVPGGA